MARYSSRLKGPGDLALAVLGTFITELDIERFYDDGPCLVSGTVSIRNDAAAVRSPLATLFFDGNNFGPFIRFPQIPPGETDTRSILFLAQIAAGQHTFRIRADAQTDATQFVPGFGAALSVIQIPIWDLTNDFIFSTL